MLRTNGCFDIMGGFSVLLSLTKHEALEAFPTIFSATC
jgi:hypothetical protein